jgi:alpha-beta hydrolase superfamily lysophospholipase
MKVDRALTVAVLLGVALASHVTALAGPADVQAEATATLTIRGKAQSIRTFGARGKPAVVVSSSDGGWVRLAPTIAKILADKGFFVVGFDSKAYLSSFTEKTSTLSEADVPRDYARLVEFAATGSPAPPILVGVSEGAGLSVLAATRDEVKQKVAGVVVLGLPDKTELGWRWRDSVIYLTHGVPNEPTFSTGALIDRVAPAPLAVIHSTNDPFVPLDTIKAMMARAGEPKRLWTIASSDHRFGDNEGEFQARLLEAVAWVSSQKPAR